MLSQPEFRASRCSRYRYRYSQCDRCAQACPHDALELNEEGITIKSAACRNCGLCAATCPTEALLAENLPRLNILKRCASRPMVSFACAPSELEGDEKVPCLGTLDATMLAYLASRGVAVMLRGAHHCKHCEHGTRGEALSKQHLEAVAHLRRHRLQAVGKDNWGEIHLDEADSNTHQPDHDAGRRHLFRRLALAPADRANQAAIPAPPVPLKAIRFAAPFSTAGRELLQILLKTLPQAAGPVPSHPGLHAARVQIQSGCTACEACARACPTGALQIRESGVSWELAFQSSRCVACGLCLEICQPGVLGFASHLPAAADDMARLHGLNKQRCSRCDRFFISAQPQDMCPICEGDDADFAALFG